MTEALTVIQRDVAGLGHVYVPRGAGPFPAILLLHGSEGPQGWLAHRDAALLAAHGFLALPFPYAVGGNSWIGGDIWGVALDQTERAIGQLRALATCTGKVGVYGWSRGAEHALLVATLMAQGGGAPPPDAVAAHAAPDVVIGAWRNLFERGLGDGPPPRWSFQSKSYDASLPAWSWRGQPVSPGLPIEIEAYAGPLFLSAGDKDELWPSEMTPNLAAKLRDAGRDPEVHIYAGQLHMPDPETWNEHLGLLLDFFRRALQA